MTARIIDWHPGLESLGGVVVAIGVFDGVHLGHQALLAETVADARSRGVEALAVTFDRDPDQIVSPETAAPQLLTLADKLSAIGRTGVDAVLVVPFTAEVAALQPTDFLERVLFAVCTPLAVHVGSDFRFGRMAMGDVSTLRMAGAIHGFEVAPHELVSVDGEPVTSTRIRGLVASGKIADAARLLGGHPCVTGVVRHGRGEGAKLGFPTANVVPAEFAALPADGVYAGRALLKGAERWVAAISVGTPPTFPEARDYLEAHLIEFEGDLYDQPITVEFWERLRDQQPYGSLEQLTSAIQADVDQALEIAGYTDEELAASGSADAEGDDEADEPRGYESDESLVDDPAALAAAEEAARNAPDAFTPTTTGDWVPVIEDRVFDIVAAGVQAFEVVSPLEAARIPYCWDPYPPADVPAGLRGALTRTFSVLVPRDMEGAAREALAAAEADTPALELPADDEELGDDGIDDPAALEAAERAAQEYREPDQAPAHEDDDLVTVLDRVPFDKRWLIEVSHTLHAAGIAHFWDPYPPEDAPLLRLNFFGEDAFTLQVYESDLDAATELIKNLGAPIDDE